MIAFYFVSLMLLHLIERFGLILAVRETPGGPWLPVTPRSGSVVDAFSVNVASWAAGSFPSGSYTIWALQNTYGPTFNGLAMSNPSGVAVDSTGRILIADNGNNRLVILTSAGVYSTGITGMNGITGVAVDTSDNIYLLRQGDSLLTSYTSALVLRWSVALTASGQVATDNTHVYITDAGGFLVYKRLCSTGAAVTSWGTLGAGNTNYDGPYGIGVRSGEVFVVDRNNNRVKVTDTVGAYLRQFPISASSRGLALDAAGNVIVAENGSSLITRYNKTTGAVIDSFTQAAANGIGVASGDVLWISKVFSDHTIVKWDEVSHTRSAAFVWNNSVAVGAALGALALTVTDSDAGTTANVLHSTYFPINAREAIEIGARVRTSNGNLTPRLQVLFYNAANVLISTVTEPDWTPAADARPERSFASRVPANATQVRIGFLASVDAGPLTAIAYLDDVTMGGAKLVVADAAGDVTNLKVEIQLFGRWL